MSPLEDPTLFWVVGGIAEIALIFMLWKTGRGVVLLAMAGVLAATLCGVVIERIVVTERERVEDTLQQAMDAVVTNDYNNLAPFIAPDAKHLQRLAQWGFAHAEFQAVRIGGEEITIDGSVSPPTAQAKLTGMFYFKDRSGQWPYDKRPAKGTILLRKEPDGHWVATGYEMVNDPLRGQ